MVRLMATAQGAGALPGHKGQERVLGAWALDVMGDVIAPCAYVFVMVIIIRVSFKTGSRQFSGDEQRCNSGCYEAPTKLFYYSNPGGAIENMRALDGTRYKDLANAFRYRKEYRCRLPLQGGTLVASGPCAA